MDDDRGIREVLAHVLQQSDQFELLQAGDGVKARQILEAEPIDVVIVDLVMPRMDGLTLMQWGREHRPEVTWIILSGQGTFDDAVRAVQLGAFDFITKPLDSPQTLRVTLRNALEQRRLAAERKRLTRDLEQRNETLREQVAQLEEAVRLLCEQQETIGDDLHRAELIQRALLPYTPPPLDGFAFDAAYRPSRNVGGDLYDVVRIGERHVVVYVADAAGHGVSAAMLAVLFKHRLGMTDGQTHQPLSPSTVLSRINTHLRYQCSAPGLFVTAAYCLLDTAGQRMSVASAGHPPLILLRADGRREMIYHTGAALGLSMDAMFAEATVRFSPGDRLLLYTDGLHDLVARTDTPPADQIAEILAGLKGDGWEVLHQLLDLASRRREGEAQEDDVTLVLLTAGPSTSSIDNGQPSPAPSTAGASPPTEAEVLIGSAGGSTTISVRGRGCWMFGAPFHDACTAQVDSRLPLIVDLSACEYLDSTFLGTLHEVTERAEKAGVPVRIQAVPPAVGRLFEELGMDRVIRHVTTEAEHLPANMSSLTSCINDERNRQRMLRAHEALAGLSERNRQDFVHLIEHLRSEIQRLQGDRQ